MTCNSFLWALLCIQIATTFAFCIISNLPTQNTIGRSTLSQQQYPSHCGVLSFASKDSLAGDHGQDGEILMKISFSLKNEADLSETRSLLQSYIASFPFSAVLPVQPLTYLPREDGNGVDVSFLRKQTKEKGSIDGGIEFLISSSSGNEGKEMIELLAVRDAEGQSISKIFSEGLIIKTFVSGLYGEEGGREGKKKDLLLVALEIENVLHKWM